MVQWIPTILGSVTEGSANYTIQNGSFAGPEGNVEDSKCTTLISAHIAWDSHTGTGNLRISLPFDTDGIGEQIGQFVCQNMAIPGLAVASFVLFSPIENKCVPMAVRNNDTVIEFPIAQSGEIWFSGWFLSKHD